MPQVMSKPTDPVEYMAKRDTYKNKLLKSGLKFKISFSNQTINAKAIDPLRAADYKMYADVKTYFQENQNATPAALAKYYFFHELDLEKYRTELLNLGYVPTQGWNKKYEEHGKKWGYTYESFLENNKMINSEISHEDIKILGKCTSLFDEVRVAGNTLNVQFSDYRYSRWVHEAKFVLRAYFSKNHMAKKGIWRCEWTKPEEVNHISAILGVAREKELITKHNIKPTGITFQLDRKLVQIQEPVASLLGMITDGTGTVLYDKKIWQKMIQSCSEYAPRGLFRWYNYTDNVWVNSPRHSNRTKSTRKNTNPTQCDAARGNFQDIGNVNFSQQINQNIAQSTPNNLNKRKATEPLPNERPSKDNPAHSSPKTSTSIPKNQDWTDQYQGFGIENDSDEDDMNDKTVVLVEDAIPSREEFDDFITKSKLKGVKKTQITKIYEETRDKDEALKKMSVGGNSDEKRTMSKRFQTLKSSLKTKMGITDQSNDTVKSLRERGSKGASQK